MSELGKCGGPLRRDQDRSHRPAWERIAQRLAEAVRTAEGRDPEASVGIVDARSVKGAATVTGETRGFDAGKKVSVRKAFGVVDCLGLVLASVVVAANISDNVGGVEAFDRAQPKTARLAKMFCDAGFKRTFLTHCRTRGVAAEVVNRIHAHRFVPLPRRWIVERTWAWLSMSRRLQTDDERDPAVTEGFIWAAHSLLLIRRLTTLVMAAVAETGVAVAAIVGGNYVIGFGAVSAIAMCGMFLVAAEAIASRGLGR